MENASAAFLDAVRRSMRVIRTAIGATTINPELLTCAERLQYEGYLRRKDINAAIMALVRDAIPLKEIVRRTGYSRKLVRQVSRGDGADVFRTRQSTLDSHLPFLDAQWTNGCHNGAELWRRLQALGFRGLPAGGQRVDDTAAAGREGDRSATSESAVGTNNLKINDHGARSSEQGRYCDNRCHRGARSRPRRSPHVG